MSRDSRCHCDEAHTSRNAGSCPFVLRQRAWVKEIQAQEDAWWRQVKRDEKIKRRREAKEEAKETARMQKHWDLWQGPATSMVKEQAKARSAYIKWLQEGRQEKYLQLAHLAWSASESHRWCIGHYHKPGPLKLVEVDQLTKAFAWLTKAKKIPPPRQLGPGNALAPRPKKAKRGGQEKKISWAAYLPGLRRRYRRQERKRGIRALKEFPFEGVKKEDLWWSKEELASFRQRHKDGLETPVMSQEAFEVPKQEDYPESSPEKLLLAGPVPSVPLFSITEEAFPLPLEEESSLAPLPIVSIEEDDPLLKRFIPEVVRLASSQMPAPPSMKKEEEKKRSERDIDVSEILSSGVSDTTLAAVAAKKAVTEKKLARNNQVLAYIQASEEAQTFERLGGYLLYTLIDKRPQTVRQLLNAFNAQKKHLGQFISESTFLEQVEQFRVLVPGHLKVVRGMSGVFIRLLTPFTIQQVRDAVAAAQGGK